MNNNKIWVFLKPVIVLTVIAAVMAGLLGGTNLLTKDKIKKLEENNKLAAVEKVIKADNYIKSEIESNGKSYEYFKATNKDNNFIGYAFTLDANGYGGAVKTVVGIDASGKITAIEIIDVANETPGLGQNATKPEFTNRFKGKNSALSVVKSGAKENEVQAVTGATITSTAVTNSVNLAFELFAKINAGGAR